MTPFDWFLVVVFALAAFWGLKSGLIDAVLTTVGVYLSLLLSGQFAYRLVNFFTDDIESRAIATAIGYVVIFVGIFIAARLIGTLLRTGMKFLMLGWVDRLGGLAFGMVAGVLLVSGLVAAGARFGYDPETRTPIPAQEKQFRARVQGWLVTGEVPKVVVNVRGALPFDFLGIMPDDFGKSLDALEADIDAEAS